MNNKMKNHTLLLKPFYLALSLILVSLNSHSANIGQLAPDFTLASSLNNNIRLAEQRGQVIMINFWATWCNPCRVEIPQLQKLYKQYKDIGFTVLGISIDKNKHKAALLARKLKASFPVLFDNAQSISKLYSIKTMPFTLLIDRDGKIRYIFKGYKPGYEQKYEKAIRLLLKE